MLSYYSLAQQIDDYILYNTSNSELIYDEINCLEFDSYGNLWVGTSNGISIYTESTDSWNNIINQQLIDNTPLNSFIQSIESAPENIFIGTSNGLAHIYFADGNLNNPVWNNSYDTTCINDNNIRAMLWNESLWVGTTGGLCVEGAGPEGTWLMGNTNTGFYSNNITSIKKNNSNNLIAIGTMNGGLVTFDNTFNIYYNSNSDILDNTVWDVAFDQNNNIILCTPQAGMGVLIENGSWLWFNTVNSNISTNSLTKVIVDINNNVWMSSLESGLIKYSNNNFYNYNTYNSNIPDNIITSLTIGPDNNLWLGTKSQGLMKINIIESSIRDDEIKEIDLLIPTIFKDYISIESHFCGELSIFNQQGKLIHSNPLKRNNKINTEVYAPGLYIFIIRSDNYITIKKSIKY